MQPRIKKLALISILTCGLSSITSSASARGIPVISEDLANEVISRLRNS